MLSTAPFWAQLADHPDLATEVSTDIGYIYLRFFKEHAQHRLELVDEYGRVHSVNTPVDDCEAPSTCACNCCAWCRAGAQAEALRARHGSTHLLDALEKELADAREAVGSAWFSGGGSLANAIRAKCRALDSTIGFDINALRSLDAVRNLLMSRAARVLQIPWSAYAAAGLALVRYIEEHDAHSDRAAREAAN